MASTGARLRQTFRYPTDSGSSDGSRDELDEEEQDNLISNLLQEDTQQNALYSLIFTILPLLFILPFVFTLPTSPLVSILGITSLLISAGRMRFSSAPPSPSPLDPASPLTGAAVTRWFQLTDFEHRILDAVPEDGPLSAALPWLNGAICAVLCLTAMVLYWRGSSMVGTGFSDEKWVVCLLPGAACGMVEVAIRSMRDVEKGVGELKRLRYRYKGA